MLVDRDLLAHERLWAAAGLPDAVFSIRPTTWSAPAAGASPTWPNAVAPSRPRAQRVSFRPPCHSELPAPSSSSRACAGSRIAPRPAHAGASPAVARRLAGPREVKVGQLLGAEALPERPVRVAGRIRCRDPLELGDGERLVAYHRDVEVRIGGTWRSIERLRETRSFDLWDHDGSLSVDPSRAAEPLIVIPKVWRGDPAELEEPHASAVARLTERHGPATEARATTRSVNVTDRLLVLARASPGRRRAAAPGAAERRLPASRTSSSTRRCDCWAGASGRLVGGARSSRWLPSIVLIVVGGLGAVAERAAGRLSRIRYRVDRYQRGMATRTSRF